MITRLRVQGFKALRDVDVPLGRFNVLIGPNDTGKTSFLEAAYALANTTRHPVAEAFWSPWDYRELVYGLTATEDVEFTATLSDAKAGHRRMNYSLTLRFYPKHKCHVVSERIEGPDVNVPTVEVERSQTMLCDYDRGNIRNYAPPLADAASVVADLLHPAVLARWEIEALGMPSHLPPESDRREPFDPSGYGLSTKLAELKLYAEDEFGRILEEFRSLFPEFTGIAFKRRVSHGFHRDAQFQKISSGRGDSYEMILQRKDGVDIPAALASGGTLVTLAFLTLANLDDPAGLFLVEEPENGLHPGKLREVVKVLRDAALSGADRQVIVTTHSPLLLDYVQPEDVRVFLRKDDGDITVHDLSKVPDIQDRLKYLMLGELVYNEGEEQLVKEIPEDARAGRGRGE